ncbi:MAG: hypothetical protein Unbinned3992contig1000_42 [Prokaryotic dsDNA virus sp.]|nr:MAG: hypothetical protein Unbinned3992contig1000_42 [Prokaryotic dsDNA virus sp.]|tara:strand:+ start:7349 stop:7537 length:189 start_codon:yes stop_codon:yes gene_type:complete
MSTRNLTLTEKQLGILKEALLDRHNKLSAVAGVRPGSEPTEAVHYELDEIRRFYTLVSRLAV